VLTAFVAVTWWWL